MPLKVGSSREIISENIKEMMAAGHSQEQAVAAALRNAGKSNKDGALDAEALKQWLDDYDKKERRGNS